MVEAQQSKNKTEKQNKKISAGLSFFYFSGGEQCKQWDCGQFFMNIMNIQPQAF